jgi:hypothetical protein
VPAVRSAGRKRRKNKSLGIDKVGGEKPLIIVKYL